MWSRQTAREFKRRRGSGNRRAFRAVVAAGPPPGVLAYADDEPVGWCAVAPRSAFVRLATSRVMAPVDDAAVWSVVCFYVARGYRGRGLTTRLLREAVRLARRLGARIVEGYPVDSRGHRTADVFVWTGLAGTFRQAGFREALRRSPTRPIMRLELRGAPPGSRG
ncbi:MAG: GNAT family N-acetyltransferase [Candidatus Rokuibacteriota bacterium]